MSSTITKVALAGATGNLGPAILAALVKAGFAVTVLTRQASPANLPPSVTAVQVDYDSLDSLVSALTGQDAVISTIAGAALSKQLLLIDAAVQAGVKRFLPSEFGSNTLNAKTAALPITRDKVTVQAALAAQAAANPAFSYTLVINGPFLDWCAAVGLTVDVKKKHIVLYDGGERKYSATTLGSVGKAVVGVLRHTEETRNRPVYVQDVAISQRELAEIAKRATGGPDGWTEEVAGTEEALGRGWAELKGEKPNPMVFFIEFLKAVIWGEGYGSLFEKVDNELLGLKGLTDGEVQTILEGLV
ncbi:hypothetical protein B0T22DRAFT_418648 [Podospora appendiculata]|uniref:NmrA-like domain-containing protein n=1 Tax=Podospora appendiculata TaxID=314037 RepID=A0AAE0XLP9_9PEZI|nr:hypothetical protein B0T22DRAFT_418648 [Podospora appendiculata]